jgi:hypothetical protein
MEKRFIAIAVLMAASWISAVSAILWVIYWK